MPTKKPTFVLVPGAWHPSFMYSTFLTRLQREGYPAIVASYPSLMASNPSSADCQMDSASIRQQLMPLIESDGQDIVMLCHSFGGISGGCAARDLGKTFRSKQGKIGGVIGLVYMTSFVVPEGQSVLSSLGGKYAPFITEHEPSQGLCAVSEASEIFYSDVSPKLAADLASCLLPHAMKAFESPAPPPAWAQPDFRGRLAFLRCNLDQVIPTFVQDSFIEKSGVKWHVKEIEASHSSYISRPEETIKILVEWAEKFQAMRS